MILGAQYYSLRKHTQTAEDISETFRRVREIGYDVVQISGIGADIPATLLKTLSEKYRLPITCTHSPLKRIVEDTEALIAEHKLYGCTEIGLGYPGEYQGSREKVQALIDLLEEPVKKIKAAGMTFAYHNHAIEFDPLPEGGCMYDMLIAQTDWNFIPDTYWLHYAGQDVEDTIRRLQGRVLNLHYKDMKEDPKGPICPCGQGVLDFAAITKVCEETGIQYVLVEQDNACELVTETMDEFDQMKQSCDHLRPIIYR